MTYMSSQASNACIYTTYGLILVFGCTVAWMLRNRAFTNSNGTKTWFPLSMNFVASGLGSGLFVAYPQIAAYAGLHGLLVYALSGAIPMMVFAGLGPIIRRRCPHGFVLTEWIRQRYGVLTALLFSACTILTLFLFMVSELAAVQTAVTTMTGLDGLPALIVECVVAGIYTSLGGFQTSFVTDVLQGLMAIVLVCICVISIGANVRFDHSVVGPSGLLKGNVLGWKLLYILLMAIMTNDCFMAGFWLRTFASRTNRDLFWGCAMAGMIFFVICTIIGLPGLFAVWTGLLDPASESFYDDTAMAFYMVLLELPRWVNGFVLVAAVIMSTSALDSMQSAMASTVSNDWFRNRVRMIYIRLFVLATMAPCIVVALRAPNVMNIWLICDILSSVIIPVLFFGLSKYFYFLSGFEIMFSLVGGILGVFIFGTIYSGNASEGAGYLLLEQGLYGDDWAAFGTFVAAPVCSVIGAIVSLVVRGIVLAIIKRRWLALFDKPTGKEDSLYHHLFEGAVPSKNSIPWYEKYELGPWAKKVDYYLFVQGDNSEEDGAVHLKDHHSDVESSEARQDSFNQESQDSREKVPNPVVAAFHP